MNERYQLKVIDRIETIKLDQKLGYREIAKLIWVSYASLHKFMHLELVDEQIKRKIDRRTMAIYTPKSNIKGTLLWPKKQTHSQGT